MQSPIQGESNSTNIGDIFMHSVKPVLNNRIVVNYYFISTTTTTTTTL